MTAPVTDVGFSYELDIDLDLAWPASNTPDWRSLAFITEVDPANEKEREDISTYANRGGQSNAIVGESWTLTFNHQLHRNPSTHQYIDVLQKLVDAAAYGKRNRQAMVHVRFYDSEGSDYAYEGYGYVSQKRGAKGNRGVTGFDFTIDGDGPLTKITNPALAGPSKPLVGSVLPSGQGQDDPVVISGVHFTGASAVSFGGTAASSFSVLDNNTIVAVLPAGAAGTVQVVVTNATGASDPADYVRT